VFTLDTPTGKNHVGVMIIPINYLQVQGFA
jgi:hypothetical protein